MITSDPAVMLGKPVIAGTRIAVEEIRARLDAGEPAAGIAFVYRLSEDDVREAAEFAAKACNCDRSRP